MQLRALQYNPFVPIPEDSTIDELWNGPTEDWFAAAVDTAPSEIQEWAANAPALVNIMADFLKLALSLMPQRDDLCAMLRIKLDGTLSTTDRTARRWLWVNTEAIQGREWMLPVFLQPVLLVWHPYVQRPTVSHEVAKDLAMSLYCEVQDWRKISCAHWVHQTDSADGDDASGASSSSINSPGPNGEILASVPDRL